MALEGSEGGGFTVSMVSIFVVSLFPINARVFNNIHLFVKMSHTVGYMHVMEGLFLIYSTVITDMPSY